MRRIGCAVVLIVLMAVSGLGAEPARLMIVDQTSGLVESMQVEVLARVLLASQAFTIKAAMGSPDDVHTDEPFDFVIIVPHGEPRVWICMPGLPGTLDEETRNALAVLNASIIQVFAGERQPLGPADDLYPFFWSAAFLRRGIL